MPRVREVLARRDAVAQLAVVVGAFAAYEAARHAMEPNWAQAFANARRIASVEQVLGLAWEQSLQRAFLALPDLMHGAQHLLLRRPLRLHGDLLRLALPPLVGRLPQLPRRLPDRDRDLGRRPLALPDRAAAASPASGSRTRCCVFSGIDIGSPTSAALSNPVAAVPSLHAAYALGVGIGVMRYARSHLVRLAGAIYPPLVVLTIVVTGNHFVLDAVAGIAVIGAGFLAVRWWRGRNARAARASARRERALANPRVAATMDAASRGGAAR